MKKEHMLTQVEISWMMLLIDKDIAENKEILKDHPGHPLIELRIANMEDIRTKFQGQKEVLIPKNNRAPRANMEER